MLRLVNELPEGKEWLYEVKFDGYAVLLGFDRGDSLVEARKPFHKTTAKVRNGFVPQVRREVASKFKV